VKSVGQMIFAFFEDYLKTQKGLRLGSIRSYRDTLKLFLAYVASSCRRPITRLILSDLVAQRVLDFLHMIEVTRGNHVSTRNQRLAALHTFYRYFGLQYPEMLAEAQRVEAIPMKRTALPNGLLRARRNRNSVQNFAAPWKPFTPRSRYLHGPL
jgi:integrase/recombinase XerD